MSWQYAYETDIAASDQMHAYLHDAVSAIMAAGQTNAAAFCRFDPSGTGGSHFYLSPEASALAATPRWKPCSRPSRADAGSLMVGDRARIDALFQ